MAKQSNEAFFWVLFTAGGVVAALLVPVQLFLFGLAIPLGWVQPPTYEHLMSLVRMPGANLFVHSLQSVAVSLGASLPFHSVRRPPSQALE